MRILILGAGALGGFFGARLLAAGRDVTFLVRPARSQQLATQGLHVLSGNGDLHLPPPGTTPQGIYDCILLTPKAWDLPAAIADVLPYAGPATLILPLLNGMAHLETLDRHFAPENVLGGLSNISATRTPDGTIHHLSRLDRFYFGPRHAPLATLPALAEALASAEFNAELRPDILHDMWDKWMTITTAAGVTCLLRGTIGDVVASGATAIVRQILAEATSIAAAAGYPTSAQVQQEILEKFTLPGSPFTASMLRDIENNSAIEREQIFGDLLMHASKYSLQVPLLQIANHHLATYEARRTREQK